MHSKSALRDPVIDAFDSGYPGPEDIVNNLGGFEEAKHIFGRLHNCSDILPGDIVDIIRSDWVGAEEMKRNTFGSLAQWMIRHIEQ
jgi:hypothetical protein